MRTLLRMAALAITASMIATSCSKDDNATGPGTNNRLLSPRTGMVLEYVNTISVPAQGVEIEQFIRQNVIGDTTIGGERFFKFEGRVFEDRQFTIPVDVEPGISFRSFRDNGLFVFDPEDGQVQQTLKFPMTVGEKFMFNADGLDDDEPLELECTAVGKQVTVQGKNYTVTEMKGQFSFDVDFGIGFPVRINADILIWAAAGSGIVRESTETTIVATGDVFNRISTDLLVIR